PTILPLHNAAACSSVMDCKPGKTSMFTLPVKKQNPPSSIHAALCLHLYARSPGDQDPRQRRTMEIFVVGSLTYRSTPQHATTASSVIIQLGYNLS
ncbi:hypothetical protein N9B17_02650, partial [Rhodopirellula sp.]|nr:hypothetical protein [Rhodopirellula sp.]